MADLVLKIRLSWQKHYCTNSKVSTKGDGDGIWGTEQKDFRLLIIKFKVTLGNSGFDVRAAGCEIS